MFNKKKATGAGRKAARRGLYDIHDDEELRKALESRDKRMVYIAFAFVLLVTNTDIPQRALEQLRHLY